MPWTTSSHTNRLSRRETENRCVPIPNPLAPWELRIGEILVYYDVEEEPEKLVVVLAIGIKDHSRIIIGGEEVEL